MQAYSTDLSSILNYKISREERTKFDGKYEILNNSYGSFFQVNSRNGQILLNTQRNITLYTSILVVVEIADLVYDTKPTQCLVDFRFSQTQVSPKPKFIGDCVRYQDLCEDMPVNSIVYSFKAFDPNLEFSNLCYSINPSDYFSLVQDGSNNGDVILKKKFDFELMQANTNRALNISAGLFFCDRPEVLLDKQTVIINIQQVNKYPPLLMSQVAIFHSFN